MKKKVLLLIIMLFPLWVNAKDITNKCKISLNNSEISKITDDNHATYVTRNKYTDIKFECEENIKNVYIKYHDHSVKGKILFSNSENIIGQNNYLHELIKLNDNINSFTISYDDDYSIADIYLYSDDDMPYMVQDWQTLEDGKADFMLFTTHADDEQLFFAGLLPTYVNQKKNIQVVYFTRHFNNVLRYHELLDGLWAVGVKYYPVVSDFPDAWATTKEGALLNIEKAGFTIEDLINYEVTQIRKYKPYVVVGHDERGEYSHGQHILNTFILEKAYELAFDDSYDEETKNKYGLWNISKLYLHLYEENSLCLDYDKPLEAFDGKTAYEVSKIGYSYHLSQQYTWFTAWLNGQNNEYTSSKDIKTYSPCKFGLYYTNVEPDTVKEDLFENVIDTKNKKDVNKTDDKQSLNIKTMDKDKKSNKQLYILLGGALLVIIILLICIFLKI